MKKGKFFLQKGKIRERYAPLKNRKSTKYHQTKRAPASWSIPTRQAFKTLLQETSELHAPPSPRRHHKPRASPSSTRNQRFNSARPRSGIREPVLPRVQSVVPARVEPGIAGLLSYSPSSMMKSSNKGQTVGETYLGIEFFQTPGRTPASGSPLGGTPIPRYEVFWARSLGPPPSLGKTKTSDKENLSYFQIWKY